MTRARRNALLQLLESAQDGGTFAYEDIETKMREVEADPNWGELYEFSGSEQASGVSADAINKYILRALIKQTYRENT